MSLHPFLRTVCFRVIVLILAFAIGSAAAGQTGPQRRLDPERLQRLDRTIQEYVDAQRIAGAVMFVGHNGETAHLKAYGQQDREAGVPMRTDSIFRIASMSKAVTTVAAMMLYEEGKFMLREPVSNYLPAFANSMVAVQAPADALTETKFVLVKPTRPIWIRDLLTHTAGLPYGWDHRFAKEQYAQANLSGWNFTKHDETIAEAIDRLATLPLDGHPGEGWRYGFGTDVLGRLVEVVSGMPLDRFVEERICRPLGMKDTHFYLPPEKAARLANVYGWENGALVLKENAEQSAYVHGPRKCFSGGAGLVSTITDYGRFLQMLLNGGELDGVRLLSPKTVELMQANHTGTRYVRDTTAFGLGFWVNEDSGAFGELVGEGAYGWGSAYYPQYFVDPKEKLVAIFMTQLLPTGGINLNQKFKVLTYQALVE